MVPNGWEIKTLDAAKVVVTDGDRGKEYPKSSDFSEDGYCLFLSAKNVTKRGFSFSEKQFISKDKHGKLRKGLVNRGDIVLTTRGTVGQFSFYDESITYEPIRINSGMVTLNFTNADIKNDFFYALSKSSIIKKQIDLAAFGSAQPQLTVKIIKSLKLPVPPLPEQRKIAKILSTWDKAISTTERLIDNSKQQKKALMQQLLTGKKRLFDDSGKPFDGEWEEVKLADVVEFNNGKGHEKHIVEDGKYLVVNSKYISSDGLVKKTTDSAFCLANVGDVLMVMSDVPNGKAIAKCLYVDTSEKFTVNQRVARFRPKSINSIFLYYTLNRNSYYLQFDDGVKQTNLRKDEVLDCPVFRPSDEEQQKIASVLVNAEQEIELLEQQLADLKQEKKALMQQLLTGKRRVTV